MRILRAPLQKKRLAQELNFYLSGNMIHEIGQYKLRQKNKPMEPSFVFQSSTNARGKMYAVLFHGLNEIGKCLANILDMDN